MFKLEFYVDDKNLGEAKKRLAGIARNLTDVYVPNLEPGDRGKKADGHDRVKLTAADSRELFIKRLRERKLGDFKPRVARDVVSEMGFSPSSYSHFINEATKAGLLGRKKASTGNGHVYFIKAEK